jgi:two-component system response regulator YesN
LIVDDEPTVSQGLAYDIAWDELGIDEVVPVSTASKALELIARRSFDIVITDIKMPEVDGLALATAARDRWEHIRLVFISGYDEFEYAQRAIGLKAYAYLTKPLDYPVVRETIAGALADLREELHATELVKDAEERLAHYLPIVRQRLLLSWIVNRAIDPDRNADRLCEAGVSANAADCALLVLLRCDATGKRTGSRRALTDLNVDSMIARSLMKGLESHVFRDDEDNVVAVATGARGDIVGAASYVQEVAAKFLSSLRYATGVTFSMFWETAPSAFDLPECYERALERSRISIRWGAGIIEGPGPASRSGSTAIIESFSKYPSLSFLVENLQLDNALARLEEIFAELRAADAITHDNLLHVYTLVCFSLSRASRLRGVPLSDWLGDLDETFHRFNGVRSGEALHEWAKNVVERYVSCVSGSEDHATNQIVERAKRVIAERIHDETTLSDIAAEAFVHPNYLSTLFKKTVGVSVSEYTTMLRIEEAKQRLKVPGARVYLVADELGYKSVSHFNRVFKRLVGCSPKEFQLRR